MSRRYHNAPADEKTWWQDVATQAVLMAQQITLFLRVESWVVTKAGRVGASVVASAPRWAKGPLVASAPRWPRRL